MRLRGGWLLAAVVLAVGCHKTSAPKSATLHYPVRGVIEGVTPANGSIDLNAETIPGFMEAMTMSYKLADPTIIGEMHKGDKITATLLADGSADMPTHMRLTDIVVVGQAKPDYKPAVQYHVPAVGDEVPDFALLNQSNKKIHLGQFKGKVLVMTFVYTRCPLAEFCPKMSRYFAELDKKLSADKSLYAETHLLSVTFDPTYDTPKVLKSYGEAYTGRYTQEKFEHWDFAAPAADELSKMEQFFDLGVTTAPDGTLQHSLSTLVIGKDGKVAAFYPANDWTVGELEQAVRKAVNGRD